MNTSSRNGPCRIILFECGKFEYAEVELDAPIHLIGPNNVGKTSLIALLQFLYVDKQPKMQFSRDMSETREYYFPGKYSFALFECLTPRGFQVVGIHGLGPVKQHDFERFVYSGRFEAEDYLDENRQMREPEEIFRRLSLKELKRPLEPKHLRAALTGVGDAREAYLGLVPARHRATYQRFRTVFGNILRLSHVRQDELKQLLLDIYANEFQQQEIDLAQNYAAQYEKVQREAHEVRELRRLKTQIERLLEHIERRDEARRLLPSLWEAVGESYEKQRADLNQREEQLKQQLEEIQEERERIDQRIQSSQEEARRLARRCGVLEDKLEKLAAKRRDFDDFVLEWKQQRAATIRSRLDELARRLGNAREESVEQLKRRLGKAREKLKRKQQQLQNLADAAVNHLRRHLEDREIADAFTVLNPELLQLSVNSGDGGIRTPDSRGAAELLRELLARREGDAWKVRQVEIDMDALTPPNLADYSDPDRIEEEIQTLKRDIERYEETLKTARTMEELREEKTELKKELDAINRRIDAYNRFQEEEEKEPEWQDELEELQEREEQLNAKIEEDEDRREGLNEAVQQNRSEQNDIGRRRSELRKQVNALPEPNEEWPGEELDEIPDEWETLIHRYEQTYNEQRNQAEQVTELLDVIEKQTYGRYQRENEKATVRALREQLENIPRREQAVQEMWTSIAVGIKKDLQNIGKDLETLKGLVSGLNRQINKFDISNLVSLELAVEERQQWVRRIRDISIDNEMPLFGDRDAAEEALAAIGQLLKDHPRVDLKDLFDLTFKVSTPDGTTYRHAHLDTIESNGTTIAIKVLVNLTLLREVLGEADVQIPFYLDECSSLDRSNLRAIVNAARRMGFIAVLASPEAMDVADKLYYINEQEDGRVVLDPETAMVRIRRRSGAESGTGEAEDA